MSKSRVPGGRVGEMILYIFAFWIALAVMILAWPWQPADAFMQAAKIALLLVGGIALLVSVIGAATGLLGVAGMNVRDPDPRP